MRKLKQSGLDKLIPTLTQPVLGICLGMQLMCKSTEENNTKGLGFLMSQVKRFSNDVKVPQMGWNTITNLNSDLFKDIKEDGFMYLVHSYYAENCDATIATTNYGINYASALQQDNFYGVQFHPEKSSKAGEQVLKNFIRIMRIIPAIDIIDGKCVRLSKGDYNTKKIYNESPLEVAKEFEEAGIKYLHLVDLDGAKASQIINYKVLEQIASKTNLKIDFGGGFKSNEDLRSLLILEQTKSLEEVLQLRTRSYLKNGFSNMGILKLF